MNQIYIIRYGKPGNNHSYEVSLLVFPGLARLNRGWGGSCGDERQGPVCLVDEDPSTRTGKNVGRRRISLHARQLTGYRDQH